MARRLKIFTPCWGEKHISLLKNCLGKSLSWPKNNAAIQGAEWFFVAEDPKEADLITNAVKPFFKGQISVCVVKDLSKYDVGISLMGPLKFAMENCIKENAQFLMATPDFIYGEGTIDAFKAIAEEPGSCVSIAHMRVLPSILHPDEYLDKLPFSNDYLVSLGFKHAHVTFSEANQRRYRGGVHVTDISPNIKAVQHYLPSPFFCNFIEKDLTSFEQIHEGKVPGFGIWDHVWPTKLIEDGRLRYIGSSDAAMMLEVTDADKNVAPLDEPHETGFFKKNLHNKIQKQFLYIYRGE